MAPATRMPLQVSFASEGGSGTPVPGLSVEVDDRGGGLCRRCLSGWLHAIEYGPADEPWGVRRFFVRDPAGTLVNIVMHALTVR
jgi:catechol 2,3-dioxygenase-like lactoylglutathione lyase family enzyme